MKKLNILAILFSCGLGCVTLASNELPEAWPQPKGIPHCSLSSSDSQCSNVQAWTTQCMTWNNYHGTCELDPRANKKGEDGNPYCVCGIGE